MKPKGATLGSSPGVTMLRNDSKWPRWSVLAASDLKMCKDGVAGVGGQGSSEPLATDITTSLHPKVGNHESHLSHHLLSGDSKESLFWKKEVWVMEQTLC